MSIDASDVTAILPADGIVGEMRVVGVSLRDFYDIDRNDAVVVEVVLEPVDGQEWNELDAQQVWSLLTFGLEERGETRTVMVSLRHRPDPEDLPEDEPLGPDDRHAW